MTDDPIDGIPGWALDRAFAETLAETVQLTGRTFPPGLNVRVVGNVIDVLSRGELIGQVSQPGLIERARSIARIGESAMNDPSVALYHRAVSLNQIAEEVQRRFVANGHFPGSQGPVATRIGEFMRTALIFDRIAGCGHSGVPAVWLPTAPELLRCADCYADAWLEARLRCAGCEQKIETGGAFVGLIDAQVIDNSVLIGPWLVAYTLCTACQREDMEGARPH